MAGPKNIPKAVPGPNIPDTSPAIASLVPEATLIRLCSKLDRAELKLKRDLRKVKALSPLKEVQDLLVNPPVSVTNTSVEGAAALAFHLSQRGPQRLPRGVSEPFYIDNELKVLEASFADFALAFQAVANITSTYDPAYQHLLVKVDHYYTVFG